MNTLEMTEYSLYSFVIMAYFLLSFYFFYIKFRHNKTQYQWLFISILFLTLGIARIFFQIHYFFVPTLEGTMTNLSLIQSFLWFYILATLFTWIGIINLLGWVGLLAFRADSRFFKKHREKRAMSKDDLIHQIEVLQKEINILEADRTRVKKGNSKNNEGNAVKNEEEIEAEATKSITDYKKEKIASLKKETKEPGKDKLVIAIRLLISLGILAIVLPILVGPIFNDTNMSQLVDPNLLELYDVDIQFENAIVIGSWRYPVGRFLLNFVLLPICIAIVPFYFLYLAKKNTGVKRTSYLFNFLGFILYMAGRIAQGLFNVMGSYALEATIPPLLVLVSLFVLYWGNHYPEL